jgi:hypothetical protein
VSVRVRAVAKFSRGFVGPVPTVIVGEPAFVPDIGTSADKRE